MTLAIVNVIVPSSGPGPAADISALTGEKTVILSGTFQGRYVLLGTHDDATYVPVLIFDANGEESIKKTLPGAVKSVKVLTHATNTSNVTLNISGISSPGDNKFTILATLAPGASGPQPVVDLFALFPPTGIETDINMICKGTLLGQIVVEGSLDGTHFNPIGSFNASHQGISLLGGSHVLEFSPLATSDRVRYMRISVEGTISSPTVVTVGGDATIGSPVASSGTIQLSDESGRLTYTGNEEILYEYVVNFDDLSSPTISARLNLIAYVSGRDGPAGDVLLYIGSTTPGSTVGGTVRATINSTSLTEEICSVAGASFANAGGPCLVQVVGIGYLLAEDECELHIRALSIIIG